MTLLEPIRWLGRHATLMAALAVFIGLIFQPLASLMKPLLMPGIILPFVISLLRVDLRTLRANLRPALMAPLMFWQLAGSAALVWLFCTLVPFDDEIGVYMIVNTASAPVMSAAAIAMLLGLDVGLAVTATLLATLILPLTLPALIFTLTDWKVELDACQIALRLAAMITAAIVAAWVIRIGVGRERLNAEPDLLAGIAVLGLAVFAIAVMDGAVDLLTAKPAYVITATLAAFALNAGLQAITVLIFKPFTCLKRSLTIGLMAGYNNIGIVLASLTGYIAVEFVIYTAVAQFPIYLLPVLQKQLYQRWLR